MSSLSKVNRMRIDIDTYMTNDEIIGMLQSAIAEIEETNENSINTIIIEKPAYQPNNMVSFNFDDYVYT